MTRRSTPSVLTALNAALKEAEPDKLDGATVALAKRYASELDQAGLISVRARKALRALARAAEAGGVALEVYEQFEALAARVEEVHVAATIGPKLLASLEQLQLTPAARRAITAGGGAPVAGPSPLDQFRARRQNRTPAVDPATS